jgi:hypothetical protein
MGRLTPHQPARGMFYQPWFAGSGRAEDESLGSRLPPQPPHVAGSVHETRIVSGFALALLYDRQPQL